MARHIPQSLSAFVGRRHIKPAHVFKHPTPRPLRVLVIQQPGVTRVVLAVLDLVNVQAGHKLRHAYQRAKGHVWCRRIARHPLQALTGVNQQRPTVAGGPLAVLHPLFTANNQVRKGLANRQCFHERGSGAVEQLLAADGCAAAEAMALGCKSLMTIFEEFQSQLTQALALELRAWQQRFESETVRIFDLGCFPWHGYLELSFLTDNEPALPDVSSTSAKYMAKWRLYNFVPNWPRAKALSSSMQKHWASADNKQESAERFFRECAAAASSQDVAAALSGYKRSSAFYVRVLNPDDTNSPNYCGSV